MGARVTVRKRVLGIFFAAALAMALLPFSAVSAYADNAATLAVTISNYDGGGLTAIANGNTVTVTGSKTGATSQLFLDIDSSVTVKWDATLTADDTSLTPSNTLISLTGTGDFEVTANGKISTVNTRDSGYLCPIYRTGSNVTISGGTVSTTGATDGYAIAGYCNVTVNGGTVSASGDGSSAIYTDGNVDVSGGVVSASGVGSTAIHLYAGTGTATVGAGATVAANGTGSYFVRKSGSTHTVTVAPGATIILSGGAAGGNYTLALHSVKFTATPAGTATGAATAFNGAGIASGEAVSVSEGANIAFKATGSGASSYTYAWTVNGAASSEASDTLAISGLAADMDVECTVTGSDVGGSSGSGGCDAGLGFAGLMALAGMALLRRKG